MAAPHEIVAAPLTVYLATIGTAFPDVDEAPGVGWTKLGTSGDKNYDEAGVTVTHGQSVEAWRAAGTTGPRKAFRTEEDLSFEFTLVDISAAQYAKVMNGATVTQTPNGTGVPGTDEFPLHMGLDVEVFAFLARGLSPADNEMVAQYEVPMAYQSGEPAPVFTKGTPAGLALTYSALEHASSGFGTLMIQTEDAS